MNDIRSKFPFFENNPKVIYFDSASTTQKPRMVLEAMNRYFSLYCANAGRGSYTIANKVTKEIEFVREKVKKFINANSVNEIVFTSGSTESLNTVAYAWGLYNLKDGDEVLVSFEDHDSTVLPWVQIKRLLNSFGIKIHLIPFKYTAAGDIDLSDIISKITNRTRLIALTHIHNVYGVESDISLLKNKISNDILLSLDASQSIGHISLDVQKLAVDFVSFSGHKMFAATGVGVLWIHQKIHHQLHPFLVGGGVTLQKVNENIYFKEMPFLLEGGTVNIAGIISLGSAIDFINEVSIEYIQEKMLFLSQYLLAKLREVDGVEFLPSIAFCRCALGYGVLSFNISGLSSNEAGFILNEKSMYVRTGTHCSGVGDQQNNSIRVSLHIYNTQEEIDRFVSAIRTIV